MTNFILEDKGVSIDRISLPADLSKSLQELGYTSVNRLYGAILATPTELFNLFASHGLDQHEVVAQIRNVLTAVDLRNIEQSTHHDDYGLGAEMTPLPQPDRPLEVISKKTVSTSITQKITLARLESWDGYALYIDGKVATYDSGNADGHNILNCLAHHGIIEYKSLTIEPHQMTDDDMPPETLPSE